MVLFLSTNNLNSVVYPFVFLMNYKNSQSIYRWISYLFLVLILLTAGYLRFYHIGEENFWLDEIATIKRAQTPLITRTLMTLDAPGVSHFIYDFIIIKAWSVYGTNEGYIRSFSAIISILSVFLMYRVSRLYFNRRVALMSAFFMALSSYMIYYAQEARAYSLQVMFLLLMVYFFERALNSPTRKKYWLLYSLVTILGIYIQVFTLFSWVSLNLYAFLRIRLWKEEIPLKSWIYAQAGIAAAISPYLIYLMIPDARETLDWIPNPNFATVQSTFKFYIVGMAHHLLPAIWIKESYWFVLLLSGLCLTEIKAWKPIPRLGIIKDKGILLGWVMFLVPFALFIIVSQVKPIFLPNRYLIICLPFFYLLWAAGIGKLRYTPIQFAAFLMVAFILMAGLRWHYHWPYKIKWSNVAQIIHQERKPYDKVWIYPKFWGGGIDYYLKDPIPIYKIKEDINIYPLRGKGRIWFIKVISSSRDKSDVLERYFNQYYQGETRYFYSCPVKVELILYTPRNQVSGKKASLQGKALIENSIKPGNQPDP